MPSASAHPRLGGERIVDLQTAPVGDDGRYVMMMLLRRSMAHKFDLQLSHQGAARSVSGMAAMLAHEIKNPLAGIRGAAQLLEPSLGDADGSLVRLICDETDRIRQLVDQMEVFSDERPLERRPVNIHVVLDRVKQLMTAGGSEGITIREDYDPSLACGSRQFRPVGAGIPEPGQERVRIHACRRELRGAAVHHRLPPRCAIVSGRIQ
jgi:two-component system nitrogen regulation sensor histidine kinase GlnL